MRFSILGPLNITDKGRPVPLRSVTQRALLGYLLLHANTVVATSSLLQALWREEPPPTARKIVQNAISGLRRALAEPDGDRSRLLVTYAPGYMLRADQATIDNCEFQELARTGRAALAAGQWDEADRHLRQALALWNGPALADLVEDGYDWPELTALQNARHSVLENRMDAALAAGRHLDVIGELEAVVSADPLRERLCRQLMLALYRSGRQAEALRAFRRTRAALVEQLGLDPAPELRELERAILDHDPSLASGGTAIRMASRATTAPPPPGSAETVGRSAPAAVLGTPPGTAAGPGRARGGSPDRPEDEHKRVTAVFVRVDTSDCCAPPEVLDRLLQQVRSAVRQQTCLYGGRNHGSMGPVTLSLFGTAQTQEDDVLRAVRMARDVAAYAEQGVRLRVAVSSGDALVLRAPATEVDDDPVDVAGRFMETGLGLLLEAAPGVVRVCETTRQACAEHFGFAATGAMPGGHDVTVALRPALASRTHLPFVQRDRELEQLRWWVEEVRRSRRPHLVTVLGVAGIGKSRLMHELRRDVTERPGMGCLVGCNRALGPKDPYTALAGVVRAYLGTKNDDPAPEQNGRLDAAVTDLVGTGPISAQLANALRPLLFAATGNEAGRHALADPECRQAVFTAWRRFVEELAVREPLLIILEDLHRTDDALLKFIGDLTENVGSLPLLVVVTARPELVNRSPYWASGRRNATTMSLEPLSRTGIEALLSSVARPGSGGHAPESYATLTEQSGGNPLFALEYARMLDGAADDHQPRSACGRQRLSGAEPPVPPRVHGIVSARLDTLPTAEKSLLYDASLFGSPFYEVELAALSDRDPEEIQECLRSLERREFLQRCRLGPELGSVEYDFVHKLVGAVAYSRMSHARRAETHRRAAQWLADRSNRPLALLVHHCRQAVGHTRDANLPVKDISAHVCDILIGAGQQARRRHALRAAQYCYRSALEFCATGDPQWEVLQRRLHEEARSPV
ncbi:BTAD domain-containing putative transcriptional regulator [Streptomyces sp. NPDC087897]|uniref:BTAD domain-containing putative transcriptional regulator n=1 Tax=Streptomyces sp. NPDC087897 TaxID=3365817 RepID=UPI003821FB05